MTTMGRSLAQIRAEVMAHKGAKVRCKTSKGRKRFEERQGVILETYPRLFTVYVEAQHTTVSYSYADILTHEVELELLPHILLAVE